MKTQVVITLADDGHLDVKCPVGSRDEWLLSCKMLTRALMCVLNDKTGAGLALLNGVPVLDLGKRN